MRVPLPTSAPILAAVSGVIDTLPAITRYKLPTDPEEAGDLTDGAFLLQLRHHFVGENLAGMNSVAGRYSRLDIP